MKKSYNKIVVPALILGILISPSLAFAASNGSSNAKNVNNFCTNIDTTATKLNTQYSKQTLNINGKKVERFSKLADSRKTRDEDISSKRLANNTKHNKNIEALTKKANTDVKKAAVSKFNSDIDIAIKKRQTLIDSATNTYRAGIDALVNGKFGNIDSNITALKASIDSAVAVAKSSCSSGVDPKAVRTTMQASVKAAHDKFRTAKTDVEIKTQSKVLTDTRNASVKAAQGQFKIEADKAKSDLKNSFGIK